MPRASAPVDLHLDANEGRPPSARVLEVLAGNVEALRRYPDRERLQQRLGEYVGVHPKHVLVTNGGDDAIDRACRAYLSAGRNIVMPTPSFEMIARYAQLQRAEVRRVEWADDAAFPSKGFRDAIDEHTGVIAIVTPNNPTGTTASVAAIREIAEAHPDVLVLVDLAYIEFADVDPTLELLSLENVVMIRTLSKAWGLAGLRVGYAVSTRQILGVMRAAGGPYPMSAASIELACAALDHDGGRVDGFLDEVRREREVLRDTFSSVGIRPSDSQANFVFGRVPGRGAWYRDAFAGMGIGIRAWPGRAGLDDAIRITCPGNSKDFERLQNAIEVVTCPDGILLDMDGILADVSRSYRQAIVDTAASWGVEVSGEDIAAIKAQGNANNDWVVTQKILADNDIVAPLDEVTRRFESRYQGDEDHPGLWQTETLLVSREWLESLAARFTLAVVTGRPRKDAERFVEHHGLEGIFKSMVCMEDARLKPSPEPLIRAMKEAAITRAWMVGDTPDDLVAARAAGVLPVGVLAPGDSDVDALYAAGAAWVLHETRELSGRLPGQESRNA